MAGHRAAAQQHQRGGGRCSGGKTARLCCVTGQQSEGAPPVPELSATMAAAARLSGSHGSQPLGRQVFAKDAGLQLVALDITGHVKGVQ